MDRLPRSFRPLVDKSLELDRKIERIHWDEESGKVTLRSRNNYTDLDLHDESHDYAIIAVPFSVVRRWRLPR